MSKGKTKDPKVNHRVSQRIPEKGKNIGDEKFFAGTHSHTVTQAQLQNINQKTKATTSVTTASMSSEGVIYKAAVITNSSTEKYVGHMADRFRDRYSKNIQHLDEHENRKKQHLLDMFATLKIRWELVCRTPPFSPTSRACNLCLAEKWNIVFGSESASWNKRQEIFNQS